MLEFNEDHKKADVGKEKKPLKKVLIVVSAGLIVLSLSASCLLEDMKLKSVEPLDLEPSYSVGSFIPLESNHVDWSQIEQLREENKENPLYPMVYWISKDKVFVKVGDIEQKLTPEEAMKQFAHIEYLNEELTFLLQDSGYETNSPAVPYFDDVDKLEAIDQATQVLIEELGLYRSEDDFEKLENACRLHKYISINNTYDEELMDKKKGYDAENIIENDLYEALVNKRGVCTSNSIMFRHIMNTIGIETVAVALTSSDGTAHMANLVSLNGKFYYFDTTLEGNIYREYCSNPSEFMFCVAGLGGKVYEEFYHPEGIMPDNAEGGLIPLPDNISEGSVPVDILNSIVFQVLPQTR